ncbi:response regulator transcription factor [Streptomyces ipomoeae]|uniref:response regulator transcription factor n=1 Tax=Streptomyces ipomoeae TaxID=103232 RepID=UPI0029B050D7|nr:response regulator transcription factor [Streptomyces ipomoeae]MDX2872531.1 response regulator transcription factor [Streptomyces ipomoeae]
MKADAPRVVIADDQALVRTGFNMILTADGIDVVAEAADGEEAVEAVHRTHPDLVLMDIRMPGTDGLEATRRILATGLSNAELATHFQLSEATVKTHVARILAKLHLRDRAQAVVVAYETGLIVPGTTAEAGSG